MAQEFNLGLAFLRIAAAAPDAPAVTAAGMRLGLGDLAGLAVTIGRHLDARGIARGRLLAVESEDPVAVLATLLASALTGSRWTMADAADLAEAGLAADLRLVTGDGPVPAGALRLDESWAQLPPGAAPGPVAFPGHGGPDDDWLLLPARDRLGAGRLVALSPRHATARVEAERTRLAGTALVSLLPPAAPAGLIAMLAMLLGAGHIVERARPDEWLAEGVGTVLGPAAAVAALLGAAAPTARLPLLLLTEPALPEVEARRLLGAFDRLLARLLPVEAHEALATEIGHDATGNPVLRPLPAAAEAGVAGPQGEALPVGAEGALRLRGPLVIAGYIGAPEASATAFRDGWFYPGLAAVAEPDGAARPTGGGEDWLAVGAEVFDARILDYILGGLPGVLDAIAFLMPRSGRADRLTALLQLAPGTYPTDVETQARVQLSARVGRGAVPEKFLFSDGLPRDAAGRPDRRGCVALVRRTIAARRAAHG